MKRSCGVCECVCVCMLRLRAWKLNLKTVLSDWAFCSETRSLQNVSLCWIDTEVGGFARLRVMPEENVFGERTAAIVAILKWEPFNEIHVFPRLLWRLLIRNDRLKASCCWPTRSLQGELRWLAHAGCGCHHSSFSKYYYALLVSPLTSPACKSETHSSPKIMDKAMQ